MVTNGNFGEKVADYHTMITNSTVDTSAYHNSVSVNGDKVTKVITGDISHKQPYNCLACGQLYKYSSGLSRHRKICSKTSNVGENAQAMVEIPHLTNQGEFKEIVLMLLKENKEIQKTFVEMIPHIKGNAEHSYNNTNSNNTNHFNIQMFLNEHCKNAMNLTDFIDTLPITPELYDNTIENGLTKAITNMITNGLSQLDVLERPIHCTDATRKTLYVKEEDIWGKDDELLKVLMGIQKIARKQRSMINKWKDINEGWDKDETIQLKFTNLVCQSMTDIENDEKETGKIIRSISKNTYLTNEIKNEYK
tara:strand:- start:600 stop:1520 length:921 start_codon:yes stop_codon:yes gene_type:complete